MTTTLLAEQLLNGLQFGLMLFLIAAGLTLVFGIMDMLNLAHGSLYMIGAYVAASVAQASGSFSLAVPRPRLRHGLVGVLLETTLLRQLYRRDHLSQVLGDLRPDPDRRRCVMLIWGPAPIMLSAPAALSGPVELARVCSTRRTACSSSVVGLALALAPLLLRRQDAHRNARARRQQQPRNGERSWA